MSEYREPPSPRRPAPIAWRVVLRRLPRPRGVLNGLPDLEGRLVEVSQPRFLGVAGDGAMNEHEIDRIAAAMNQLRPDWPVKSLRTLLTRPELASRARRDVTVALAWVACESGTSSPARVIEAGPWWRAAGIEGTLTNRHPKPADACHRCGREYGPNCCDNPTQRPAPGDSVRQAAVARELLRAARGVTT
jgi:hypothetical protein